MSGSANISGVQRITYRFVENIDSKEECGTRYPILVEGTFGLTGTIERFHTGSGIWSFFDGTPKTATGSQSYRVIGIYPAGWATGNPFIELHGTKFSTKGGTQRTGTNLYTDTLDFIATGSIVTGSI